MLRVRRTTAQLEPSLLFFIRVERAQLQSGPAYVIPLLRPFYPFLLKFLPRFAGKPYFSRLRLSRHSFDLFDVIA